MNLADRASCYHSFSFFFRGAGREEGGARARVCVCVCVCEGERGCARGKRWGGGQVHVSDALILLML